MTICFTGSTVTILSTGEAIAISFIITFIVAAILGFLTGLLVMHLCSRKKAVYSSATKEKANVGPTAPVGPVYEEVSPKEEIELNTNQAYGPVALQLCIRSSQYYIISYSMHVLPCISFII